MLQHVFLKVMVEITLLAFKHSCYMIGHFKTNVSIPHTGVRQILIYKLYLVFCKFHNTKIVSQVWQKGLLNFACSL